MGADVMRGFIAWGIVYSVCGVLAWFLLGAIFFITLYLAYLSSFPAVLCAIFLAPVAVFYWVWRLYAETGNAFHFLTLMCLGWIALKGIGLFAKTRMANWKPKELSVDELASSTFETHQSENLIVETPVIEEVPAEPLLERHGFKVGEFIVYPAHGVGQILAVEEQEIAGARLELFVMNFMKDKMTLRVPTRKVANVGMRKLSDAATMASAQETLVQRPNIATAMWSNRAQEFEAKINSGDIVAVAEVVRDLYRSETGSEQGYSERQLYEAALDRYSREIAVIQQLTDDEARKKIEDLLAAAAWDKRA